MFWKRGNKWGTLASIGWGMVTYALANTFVPQIAIAGTHPSFVSIVSSVIVYVLVSLLTEEPSTAIATTFWGRATPYRTKSIA
jgi:Na+/proline symporter